MTSENVSLVCLETSHIAPRSSDHDQQHDTILFEMVDEHQSFHNRNFYPSLEPSVFPLYGHQSLWIGSSYRANETILSWSLDGRPIPAPYQYARNDDHSLCTKKSHNIYSSYLCHDIYGQHNSGLLYQQTRLNSLSQPVYRGLEDSHLCLEPNIVIRIRPIPGKFNILADRLSTLDKPIKIEWALDQMIPIPYSKCSNIQMWICLRLDSVTNSHCIYPLPDSHALAVHALSMNWNLLHAFAFPLQF